MNLSIGTKIGAGYLLVLGLLLVIGVATYQNTAEMVKTQDWIEHTDKVLLELETLSSNVLDVERGVRGFLLTGKEAFLTPYQEGIPRVENNLLKIKSMTADNPKQQHNIEPLEIAIKKKFAENQTIVNERRDKGFDQARALAATQEGHDFLLAVRDLVGVLKNEESELLRVRKIASDASTQSAYATIIWGTFSISVLVVLISLVITRNITRPLRVLMTGAEMVGAGKMDHRVPIQSQDETGQLATVFNSMSSKLQQTYTNLADQDWLKSNIASFSVLLQGQRDLRAVCKQILSELSPLINCQHGVIYVNDVEEGEPSLKILASYGLLEQASPAARIKAGEGLVGQCALERKRLMLADIPENYIRIGSGLGSAKPRHVILLPIQFEKRLLGVIELASFNTFQGIQLAFLDQLTQTLGVLFNVIAVSQKTEELLKTSQLKSEELRAQQEELAESYNALQSQAEILKTSEERLKLQQEELRQTNEELEEKTGLLLEQNSEVERKNKEIELARQSLEDKAAQLAQTSKYKSEFLANMSHELRTPLNSLLILSQQLRENNGGNLSEKQVQWARIIYESGSDLLTLINDILDLAKIESGTMVVDAEDIGFDEIGRFVDRMFRHMADKKEIGFNIQLAPGLPPAINTDSKRLQQVLKNLLANAFKFTETGSVTMKVEVARQGWSKDNPQLNSAATVIEFSITDTGIGIQPDKQKLIFEAFQQADGSTSRKYGGTGLGLSICREIARLLGGEIALRSTPGEGSTFIFYVPLLYSNAPAGLTAARPGKPDISYPREARIDNSQSTQLPVRAPAEATPDDRNLIIPGDRILLIVEDDAAFSSILLDLAHQKGFKGIITAQGNSVMSLAHQYRPDAITLDIKLPGMDGWKVLDRLKSDPVTRHIPVQIMTVDEERERGLKQGAFRFETKPVSRDTLSNDFDAIKLYIDRPVKSLLVIEDSEIERQNIIDLVGDPSVKITGVGTAQEALDVLRSGEFDCIVLDLNLPGMNGFQFLEELEKDPKLKGLPVIVNTGRELNPADEMKLRKLAKSIIVKDVRTSDRLLDETSLFLHRVHSRLPLEKRQILERLHQSDSVLAGKSVLVVDDDIRNIFALASVLERHEMRISTAENGREALKLIKNGGLDIILMDIMMPEMDGYETMREIRKLPEFESIPILAITAKAMKGDREACIEAGASDYISKPVDTEQLLSMLRVWLFR